MSTPCYELCVRLDSVRSLSAPPGERLPAGIADELVMQARAANERLPLSIRFVAPDADDACANEIAVSVRKHFARVAHLHELQIRDIFRFARVSSVVGLLCVVMLLALAQAIPGDAGKLINGVREGLNIFAWVVMWRPAELSLYAHLPERHWRRLALRLGAAQVTVESVAVCSRAS